MPPSLCNVLNKYNGKPAICKYHYYLPFRHKSHPYVDASNRLKMFTTQTCNSVLTQVPLL